MLDLPELAGIDARRGMVRIPPEVDVPLTPRVRRLIDTPQFHRLAGISQLGLVSLVYPAAIHTRFEHSLGVYRLALLFLRQLDQDARFAAAVSNHDAERLIVAALVHDIGHWPFCHPLEDIRLPQVPRHEALASSFLHDDSVARLLRDDWHTEPQQILALLAGKPRTTPDSILASMLSGPIDIDKMDYLARDSLHAGVPYGRNFDQQRLIGSLCLNQAGTGLAITDKGKTAAEMMVFARYVMFSEVYWHHGVRAATAMLQRAFFILHERLNLEPLFRLSEADWIRELRRAAAGGPAAALLEGLFGPQRRLYKRLAQYSLFEERAIYDRLARRPYPWLARCAAHFAEAASSASGQAIAAEEVLFDAPPVEREVEFNVEVYYHKAEHFRQLSDVSPVVRTLAKEQFDDYVKRVRIFVSPRIADALRAQANLPQLLNRAIDRTDA